MNETPQNRLQMLRRWLQTRDPQLEPEWCEFHLAEMERLNRDQFEYAVLLLNNQEYTI